MGESYLMVAIMYRNNLMFYNVWMFSVIYAAASLYTGEEWSGTQRFIVLFLLCAFLLIKQKKVIIPKNNSIILFFILSITTLLSLIVNGLYFELDIGGMINMFTGLIVASQISQKKYIQVYCSVMRFLSFCSIIGVVIYYIYPDILSVFPLYYWHVGTALRYLFFTNVPVSMESFRNWGLFHEPGMFAFYLNLALFFEFFKNGKPEQKAIMIELIALILTWSTAGYIAGIAITFAYILNSERHKKNYGNNKIWFILGIVGIIITLTLYFQEVDNTMWAIITNKFSEMNDVHSRTSGEGSGLERIRALWYSLECFINNPIFGVGFIGRSASEGINTFTPLNWFALYGIIYGILCNILYFRYAWQVGDKLTSKLLLLVGFFAIIASQSMDTDLIMYSLLFYSANEVTRVIFKKN